MKNPSSQPIRIMIVDDHAIVRSGLRSIIKLHADLEVVAEAGGGGDPDARRTRHRPRALQSAGQGLSHRRDGRANDL